MQAVFRGSTGGTALAPPSAVRITAVIPTLDERDVLPALLDRLRQFDPPVPAIVVDGGSSDGTAGVAREHGARVLQGARGRGAQMTAGAAEADADVLWFLHADTLPPLGAVAAIRNALAEPRVVGGHFGIEFDRVARGAGFLTWLYPSLALLGLRYGDSGFFVRREAYERVGGFRPLPIFEDLDLLRRLRRRGGFVRVAERVVASSRRFEGRCFELVFARWLALQLLFWLRVPPRVLGGMYPHVRGAQVQGEDAWSG